MGHDAVQNGVTYQSFGTAYCLNLQVKIFPHSKAFFNRGNSKETNIIGGQTYVCAVYEQGTSALLTLSRRNFL